MRITIGLRTTAITRPDAAPVKSARAAAARAVADTLSAHIPLETALSRQEGFGALSARDRAFARLIAATTFRRMGQIDGALKPFVKRTPPGFVNAVLRTACAQLLFLDTPPHAAVGESVALLKAHSRTRGYSGMANAVLRNVVQKGPALAAAIAPQDNIPAWLRRSWEKTYGRSAMRRMALQLIQDPPLDLTLKDQNTDDAQKWAKTLDGTVLPFGSIRLPKIGGVTALEGFESGAWWAQDISSSLPVRLLVAQNGSLKGQNVLDMCAAPGGKTLQLATAGAHVTALDRSEVRLERLHENLKRTGLTADVVAQDALDWTPQAPDMSQGYDYVLLDAPCSATGTFRRHPDVLYNKAPKDIAALVKIQDDLLQKGADLTRPGGTLIFCTCSLQYDEGEARMSRFLTERPDFRLNSVIGDDFYAELKQVKKDGYIRVTPAFLGDSGGADGFFIAVMNRENYTL